MSVIEMNSGLGAVEKFELVKSSIEIRDGPNYASSESKLEENNKLTDSCILLTNGGKLEQTTGEMHQLVEIAEFFQGRNSGSRPSKCIFMSDD
jgi:hypothetical protein